MRTSFVMREYRVQLSKPWRIWDVVSPNGHIVEGGFFSRAKAEDCATSWNVDAAVERESQRSTNPNLAR